jgi:hypothetical protein
MNLPAGMTTMTGQPLAHSLNSEPGFAAFAFSSSNVNTVEPVAILQRYSSEFLSDSTSIDEAHVGKTEQDCELRDQQPAPLCPRQGRALAGDL